MTVTRPKQSVIPNGYKFTWERGDEQNVEMTVSRFNESSRTGNISAEFEVLVLYNGIPEPLIAATRVNLSTPKSRQDFSKQLKGKEDGSQIYDIPWDRLVEYVCKMTIAAYRQGEPSEEIWPSEEVTLEAEYLIEPVLYLNHPSVLFGDYGTCKSITALTMAYIVERPFPDNPLGLIPLREPKPCLYLDYEDDISSFRNRWSALYKGFGNGIAMPIEYKRMTATLADSVDQIRRMVDEKNIKFLIVDSLGPAARGNLNDPEPAIRYHAALRELGITSLTLAHTSKDQFTKKRTIFGSVFFTNLARSVWEVKAEQEIGEDEVVISLKHTKANLSRLHPPLGFRFAFADNTIDVAKIDLKDTGLSGELPLPWLIKNLLKRQPLSSEEIAEELGKSKDTVRTTMTRLYNKGMGDVVKLPEHRWGIRALEGDYQ
jgi:hypothetical protein